MPLKFWDEAFQSAAYLINRVPSKTISNTTPLERLFHQKPDYSFLRVFGCACWPHLRPYNTHKLQFRSKQCVFLGYSNLHKGYKCLDPSIGRVYISRDVVFDENVFPFSKMHFNAGARLRSEINLLDPSLLNPSFLSGGTQVVEPYADVPPENTNSTVQVQEETGENSTQDHAGIAGNEAAPLGMQHEGDLLPAVAT